MRVTEIFTPSDFPVYTYVPRNEHRIEERLREALETPGEIVSVSGPSKSGKTVLIEKVAGRDNLITVTGAGIQDAAEVWERALDWMGTPAQVSQTKSTALTGTASGTVKGKGGIPLVASASAEGSISGGATRTSGTTEVRNRGGMSQVVREIANSTFVLLLDDFHYMSPSIQTEVAKQIKEAARQGVKICTASVPHRSDDVVRSNPELRGRVRAVDTKPWNIDDLIKIAALGFPACGVTLPNPTIRKFAVEASQSPQLMQAICLQACFVMKIREIVVPSTNRDVDALEIRQIMEETSTRTDFASLLRSMHAGPKIRGQERKEFSFPDGTRGDVYRALLLSLSADPPSMSFHWNDLSRRVQSVCRPDAPQAASLSTACSQISKMARDMFPNQRVIDWLGDPENLLSIEDPYFLFYLRWSDRLGSLAKSN